MKSAVRIGAIAAAALAAIVALAAAALFIRVPCLVVRDAESREVACFPLWGRDAAFDVSFTHSVSREPTIEHFRRGPGNRLLLVRTEYQGLGAGLPTGDEGGRAFLKDGWIVIEGLRREFSSVTLLPLPLTEHRLHLRGRVVDLAGLVGGRGRAVLSIEPRAAARALAAETSLERQP